MQAIYDTVFTAIYAVTYTGLVLMVAGIYMGFKSVDSALAKGIKRYSWRFVLAFLLIILGNEAASDCSVLFIQMLRVPAEMVRANALMFGLVGTLAVFFSWLNGWAIGYGVALLRVKFTPAPKPPTKPSLDVL